MFIACHITVRNPITREPGINNLRMQMRRLDRDESAVFLASKRKSTRNIRRCTAHIRGRKAKTALYIVVTCSFSLDFTGRVVVLINWKTTSELFVFGEVMARESFFSMEIYAFSIMMSFIVHCKVWWMFKGRRVDCSWVKTVVLMSF